MEKNSKQNHFGDIIVCNPYTNQNHKQHGSDQWQQRCATAAAAATAIAVVIDKHTNANRLMQTQVNKKTVVSNCLLFWLDSIICVWLMFVCSCAPMLRVHNATWVRVWGCVCNFCYEKKCALSAYIATSTAAIVPGKHTVKMATIWWNMAPMNGSNYEPTALSI